MGQKVHPLGFRVGITKKHQSQWFARFNKYKYAQSVLEDRMLRQTLNSLFPLLLNPVLKKMQKKDSGSQEMTLTPKITQLKIERGLIPYEIGIQIHAENCELLKSAVDNLKVNRDLVCQLQKARRYLLNLRSKLNSIPETETTQGSLSTTEVKNKSTFAKEEKNRKGFRFKARLTKQELRRQRLIKKRLRKRQSIRRRYRQLISKGLFIKKTGNKIVQKLALKPKRTMFAAGRKKTTKGGFKGNQLNLNQIKLNKKRVLPKQNATGLSTKVQSTFGSKIKKKFVTIFIQKMNKKFLKHLKDNLLSWNNKMQNNPTVLPLGYNKKWSLNRLNVLKKQPISKLQQLIQTIEQKSLVKLDSLRKDFLAFGSISSVQSFSYYQIVNFLKNLKDMVNKLKREQKIGGLRQILLTKGSQSLKKGFTQSNTQIGANSGISSLSLTSPTYFKGQSLGDIVLRQKLNNIDNECRKIKLIEYLKQIVKKHRTNNIYLYLSTISDARKDLRKLQQFTKRHSNFLFGVNSFLLQENTKTTEKEKIQDRVTKVLEKTANKTDFDKTLQDIFIEQIEKQRTMYQENSQLIPKITLKFYSVKEKSLQAKASFISDSIIDALEKRKAFRKVIKDAKENLMRTPGVKGVKIQVAGRLNGAEIARTEWVRAGRVPLQTLRANLDYSYKTANTIYGIIGVKVWIFKGYTKFIK